MNSTDGAIYVAINLTKTQPTQLVVRWDTLELSPTILQLIVAVTMASGLMVSPAETMLKVV